MTFTIDTVLLFLALVCFVLSAFGLPTRGRINLTALGLAFWVATNLF